MRGAAERAISTCRQSTSTVLMVRPATFYGNPETLATNAFQNAIAASPNATLEAARSEFDGAAATLMAAGVNVIVVKADPAHETPDAIFPNNWFSTHADGRVVLYPMAAANRRMERRPELLDSLAVHHGWHVTSTVNLTYLEDRGLIVEGTGSLVLDRVARVAYAALSPRTHQSAVDIACRELGYEPVTFHAHDTQGREIYHTNVMMSVGPSLAVLASSFVQNGADLRSILATLERTNKSVLHISPKQVAEFAGNVLFLDGSAGPIVALSRRAWKSLTKAQQEILERHALPVLCAVETIEHVGGGGIRCMLAEIFL
jgi:hypothetical protein